MTENPTPEHLESVKDMERKTKRSSIPSKDSIISKLIVAEAI